MSTEIEQYTPSVPATPSPGANLIREAAAVMTDAHKLATAIANTQMIPKHFAGKPDEIAAAMLYGATLDLDPMQSVRAIYVVHGAPGLYARSMVAVALKAGHQIWTVESTDEAVTVAGRRRGTEHVEQVTWTYERAHRAGYTSNAKYKSDPQAMLYAKAASEVARKIAPDALSGVYAVEELRMERWDAEVVATRPNAPAGSLRAALHQTSGAEGAPDAATSVSEPSTSAPESDGITPGQLKKLGALMREAGIVDRDGALAFVNDVLPEGREVSSRNELSRDEAGRVIDALERDLAPVEGEVVK